MKVKNNNIYSFSLTRTHSHTLTFNVLSKKKSSFYQNPNKGKKMIQTDRSYIVLYVAKFRVRYLISNYSWTISDIQSLYMH